MLRGGSAFTERRAASAIRTGTVSDITFSTRTIGNAIDATGSGYHAAVRGRVVAVAVRRAAVAVVTGTDAVPPNAIATGNIAAPTAGTGSFAAKLGRGPAKTELRAARATRADPVANRAAAASFGGCCMNA